VGHPVSALVKSQVLLALKIFHLRYTPLLDIYLMFQQLIETGGADKFWKHQVADANRILLFFIVTLYFQDCRLEYYLKVNF